MGIEERVWNREGGLKCFPGRDSVEVGTRVKGVRVCEFVSNLEEICMGGIALNEKMDS